MQTKLDIFISYRRSGGKDLARMIKESLTARGYNVFLDFDGLKDGGFNEKIIHAIDEAPVFLLVLSKGSMARCVEEEDWVRKEIEYALSKKKQIVPIDPNHEFDGFPEGMPMELKEQLGQHQFSILDTTQLYRESLDKIIKDRIVPVVADARKKRVRLFMYIILILVVICGTFMVYWVCRPSPDEIYQKGIECLSAATTRSDSIKAYGYVKKAAERGDKSAIYAMGVALYYGEGLNQDYEEARRWFEIAKDSNLIGAYYHLGLIKLYGYGATKNESKGIEYLEFVADNNIEYASTAYYQLGKYAASNKEFLKAAQYYNRGFELGNRVSNGADCGYELAKMCLEGKGIEQQYYVGLELLYKIGTKYSHYYSLAYLGDMGCRMNFDMSYKVGSDLQLIIYGIYITENQIKLIAKFQNNTSSPQMPTSFRHVTYITQSGQQTFDIDDVLHADKDILHTIINPNESSASFALICPRLSNEWKSIDICFNKQPSLTLKEIPLTDYTQFGLFVDDVVAIDQETILNCSYTTAYTGGGWFNYGATTYIQPSTGNEKLAMLEAEGCAIGPDHTDISFGDVAKFKLYFPSLPTHVSTFDLIEEEGSSFNKYNLSVMHDQRTHH